MEEGGNSFYFESNFGRNIFNMNIVFCDFIDFVRVTVVRYVCQIQWEKPRNVPFRRLGLVFQMQLKR